MRAVVLVGGFGTRLRPLTNLTPKPMLPLGHVPMIERLLTNLGRSGVVEVTLALGFKPEPFVAAFPDGECAGVSLRYAVEPEPLDTAGAIRFAAEVAGLDDTFIVANGDVLTDLDVSQLVSFHHSRGAEGTLHLVGVPDPSAFGVVAIGVDGKVDRFVEKPAPGSEPSNLINAGTYVLEPSVLQRIPAGQRVSIERATFPVMVADGSLYAMPTDDYWIDTGRPELYLQANLDLLVPGRHRHDLCVGVHPDASVSASAVIIGSVVGPAAAVAEGARVSGSVLLPGAVVGKNAVVTDSVVMGRVGVGAIVSSSVVGAEGIVEPGEHLEGEKRPDPTSP